MQRSSMSTANSSASAGSSNDLKATSGVLGFLCGWSPPANDARSTDEKRSVRCVVDLLERAGGLPGPCPAGNEVVQSSSVAHNSQAQGALQFAARARAVSECTGSRRICMFC
ncbi:hypothetical protein VPH35_093310 [Triticum aestivum]